MKDLLFFRVSLDARLFHGMFDRTAASNFSPAQCACQEFAVLNLKVKRQQLGIFSKFVILSEAKDLLFAGSTPTLASSMEC